MKLRIRGDSLRLRLTRAEVERLARGERVEEVMHVAPGQALRYAITSGSVQAPGAQLLGTTLQVTLPQATARNLAQTEQVSVMAQQDAGGSALQILVEKDFQCLAPRDGEDDGDAFPHPQAGNAAC